MFKDLRIFRENDLVEYTYKLENDLLLFSFDKPQKYDNLKIIYDENIYQIDFMENLKWENLKAGEILLSLENHLDKCSFQVKINNKFFVKTIYKFINKFITKETLTQEIELFLKSKNGKKYKNDLEKLLKEIENKNVSNDELLLEAEKEYDRLVSLLINNKLYVTLASQMNNQDL